MKRKNFWFLKKMYTFHHPCYSYLHIGMSDSQQYPFKLTMWKDFIFYACNFWNFVWNLFYTGCPTKHDSWWIVMNVFFHILHEMLKTFCSLFVKKNLLLERYFLWNQFFYNITAIKYFLLFSLVSNNLTHYGSRHFKLFTNCHVMSCI